MVFLPQELIDKIVVGAWQDLVNFDVDASLFSINELTESISRSTRLRVLRVRGRVDDAMDNLAAPPIGSLAWLSEVALEAGTLSLLRWLGNHPTSFSLLSLDIELTDGSTRALLHFLQRHGGTIATLEVLATAASTMLAFAQLVEHLPAICKLIVHLDFWDEEGGYEDFIDAAMMALDSAYLTQVVAYTSAISFVVRTVEPTSDDTEMMSSSSSDGWFGRESDESVNSDYHTVDEKGYDACSECESPEVYEAQAKGEAEASEDEDEEGYDGGSESEATTQSWSDEFPSTRPGLLANLMVAWLHYEERRFIREREREREREGDRRCGKQKASTPDAQQLERSRKGEVLCISSKKIYKRILRQLVLSNLMMGGIVVALPRENWSGSREGNHRLLSLSAAPTGRVNGHNNYEGDWR
ncbi:hypothetical protein BKA70DRAFT_1229246 [Coprinopsis sp. MPI-PUGE-AT-0042]|nr:hypothetical protein BKA70DRAFT_1229246 [Coprinopsis sp. MPI-PUGE-AT-0042]